MERKGAKRTEFQRGPCLWVRVGRLNCGLGLGLVCFCFVGGGVCFVGGGGGECRLWSHLEHELKHAAHCHTQPTMLLERQFKEMAGVQAAESWSLETAL